VSLACRRVGARRLRRGTADAAARGAGAGQDLFCSTDLLGRESFIVIAGDTPKPSQRTRGSSLTPEQTLDDNKVRVLTGRKEDLTCHGNWILAGGDAPRPGEAPDYRAVGPMMGR
jgi:hypothetical protein